MRTPVVILLVLFVKVTIQDDYYDSLLAQYPDYTDYSIQYVITIVCWKRTAFWLFSTAAGWARAKAKPCMPWPFATSMQSVMDAFG